MSKKWTHYDASGEKLERKKRSCPKCGPAVFLAEHKSRISCGGCGYTEFAEKREKPTLDMPQKKATADQNPEDAKK